jgi:outer membrane lipoprotein-sorting protein
MQSTSAVLVTASFLPALLCPLAFTQTDSARLASIVERVERAQPESRPKASYQVIRRYRVFGSNSGKITSEVVAEIDFQPPGRKSYVIQQSTGSRHGENVVRHILDHEVESQTKATRSRAVTHDNYDFTYLGESAADGQPCFLLGLTPKRKDKGLVSGRAWVDKSSYLIRQIEGELVKSPSFWIKKVQVTLDFGNVGGTWLETAIEAVADIRLLGSQTLKSELVDYRSDRVVAERTPTLSRIHAGR